MKIGEKIKSLRQSKSLTQKELATTLNVSSQAVSNWERDKGYPDIANIIHISDLFKVSLDILIKEDLDFKTALSEDKAERQVDIFLSSIFLIISVFIFIYNLYRIYTSGFKKTYVFGILVAMVGMYNFSLKMYQRFKK